VHRMILGKGGCGGEKGDRAHQRREDAGHCASPFGRTLTTRIIPACMW
jgi:hypothetical protein